MEVGSKVRVLSEVSNYYLLIGDIEKLTFEGTKNPGAVVAFTSKQVDRSRQPHRAIQLRVHFYLRVLQEVDEYDQSSSKNRV